MKYWAVLDSYNNLDLQIIAGSKTNAIKYIFKKEQENLINNYKNNNYPHNLKQKIKKIFDLLGKSQYIKAYNHYKNIVYDLDDCMEYELFETKVLKTINYNVAPDFLNKLITFQ